MTNMTNMITFRFIIGNVECNWRTATLEEIIQSCAMIVAGGAQVSIEYKETDE